MFADLNARHSFVIDDNKYIICTAVILTRVHVAELRSTGVETELANRAKGRTEVGKGLGGVNGRTRRRGHDHSGRKAGHQLDATKVSVIDAYLGCPNSAN